MPIDLRLPKITGTTEWEQLAQIKSYLHQLTEQLQWAFNTISTPFSDVVVQNQSSSNAKAQSNGTDSQAAFDAIKPLIIKSADIINIYYKEITSRFEGSFVAQSDFGTFSEQTSQDIAKNSVDIEQTFSNIQQALSDIESINFTLLEVNAHIKSGLLYTDGDGIPVYGLEIGQKNIVDGVEEFRKYARFSSNRLSFYDQNETEVAYISDYKLYITNVEITGTIRGGAFLLDTRKGFNLKYVGR